MCLGLTLLCLLTPPLALAQNGKYELKGTVLDAAGVPVVGATLLEKGTLNGATTVADGTFTIKVKDANSVIEVSFIGFKTRELVASSSLWKPLTLSEDLMALDDVVVIGYGSVKKNDMTGSVVAIKAEEINRGAVNSPDQLLQGKVPGLRVTPATGEPGSGASLQIRGTASLKANNNPLIVIDGVPVTTDGGAGMGNPLASVNSNDIESINVLKDASATAIYGSRASNGVIIINTKKGKGNTLQVSYNSSYTAKQNTGTIGVMSGDEYRAFMDVRYPTGTTDGDKVHALMGKENTDWQKQIFHVGFATDQNVSLFGNYKDRLPYRVSLGYNYDQGTQKGGDNQRGTIGINLAPTFLKNHLTVTINARGVYNYTNWANSAVGSALSFDPTQPIYFTKADGSIDNSVVSNGYWNWFKGGAANTQAASNPLSTLYDYVNYNKTLRSLGNLQLDYKIHGLEDLRLNLNLGYDIAQTKGTKYNNLGTVSSLKASPDLYENYKNYSKNLLLEAYIDYNKTLGKHALDVMAGYSWQHNYVKSDNSAFYNNDREKLYREDPTNAREYYLLSFFGRVNYSFDSRYMFTFTLRGDASSRFHKDNRWGLFPSAAFAWNIAQESFLKNSSAVSALKLRVGWGRTGQQGLDDDYYPYLARYVESTKPETQYPVGPDGKPITTLAPQKYNRNLKWETTETWNVGVDFGFLNGRINGAVDVYYRHTFDLLNDVITPMGSNFGNTIISNIGDMKNKGVEVALNFVPIQRKDMQWTINFNGTWQNTEITKLTASKAPGYLGVETGGKLGGSGTSSLHREGFAPFTYYLFQQIYDTNGRPIQDAFVDRDGSGTITDADKYVTGKSPMPNFFFGISTQFTYKNWDFGFNGHASFGGYLINKVAIDNATTDCNALSYDYLTNFTEYNTRTGFTKVMDTKQQYSDMFLENASFFRMDDINVGYTFRNIRKSKVNLRIAASVQNVFVITNYSGLDPELLGNDGVDGTIIPRPRLYTLRLNLNF